MDDHTIECQVAAIDRGLEDHKEGRDSGGALLGTMQARYDAAEIFCECKADAEICYCCLFTAANGESPCEYSGCVDEHPDGLCGDEPATTIISTIGYGEPHFSWSRCDLCGTRLGGDRYGVAIVREEDLR